MSERWGVHLKAPEILALWFTISEGLGGVVNILGNILVEEENMGMGGARLRCTSW